MVEQVRRIDAAGHELMLATGRSAATTIPVLGRLGITPGFLVCSNGALTLRRDPVAPSGYRREWVESFDPTDVLQMIRAHLGNARFAVEDEHGHYRYTEPFPDAMIGLDSEHVEFNALLHHPATRVVVISPDHEMEDFLAVVEKMGLHRVADGRNDIDLLGSASESGGGVAMGHAPADVIEVVNELTGTVHEDGLAQVLATL